VAACLSCCYPRRGQRGRQERGRSDDWTTLARPGPGNEGGRVSQAHEGRRVADYRATQGNRGAWCLHRHEGDIVHVEMFTLWDDLEAIRRFAGDELTKAKYYDFDPDFLLELEPEVTHFEVVE
jgi:hypothetical protein